MKQRIITLFAGGVLALALFGVAAAGQLEAGQLKDGLTASARVDYAEAMRLLRPLAEQGYPSAQTGIGLLYGNGRGVPKDYGQALAWFRKAAEQGYGAAQNNLGVMYALGQGAPQDYVQALMWFDLAASDASDAESRDRAVKNRDEASAKMTPDQIAEAQRLADAARAEAARAEAAREEAAREDAAREEAEKRTTDAVADKISILDLKVDGPKMLGTSIETSGFVEMYDDVLFLRSKPGDSTI